MMNISPATVRNHISIIYKKLQVSNKSQLAQLLSRDQAAQDAQIIPGNDNGIFPRHISPQYRFQTLTYVRTIAIPSRFRSITEQ